MCFTDYNLSNQINDNNHVNNDNDQNTIRKIEENFFFSMKTKVFNINLKLPEDSILFISKNVRW